MVPSKNNDRTRDETNDLKKKKSLQKEEMQYKKAINGNGKYGEKFFLRKGSV